MKVLRATSATVMVCLLLSPANARAETPADTVDAGGSQVEFTVYAQMIFKVKQQGRFKEFAGQVSYDPENPARTSVDLTVYTDTVDMRDPEHAAILRSEGFFDTARFPVMHFVGAATTVKSDGSLTVTGDLTIRGVTRRIEIPVRMTPAHAGDTTTRFETTFQIDRTDFGLNGSPKVTGFKVAIARNVGIHIAIATRLRPRP